MSLIPPLAALLLLLLLARVGVHVAAAMSEAVAEAAAAVVSDWSRGCLPIHRNAMHVQLQTLEWNEMIEMQDDDCAAED